MSNLIPQARVNKNGVSVIKHVRPTPVASAGKSIPPVSTPANSHDLELVMAELQGDEDTGAVENLIKYEPDCIPFVANALRTYEKYQAVDMFHDLRTQGASIEPGAAADYADICYYGGNETLTDFGTAQLAISLLHDARRNGGVAEKECFYRSDEKLRDDIGQVLSAVQSARFVAGAVDNWNNSGRDDYARTLELMTALNDRVSTTGTVDREVEVFCELDDQGFADFYEDDDESVARLNAIPSYVTLVDSIIEVSRRTKMSDSEIIGLMDSRGMRDGKELIKFIDDFEGAPVLIEGSL